MTTINERIQQLVDETCNGNISEFARRAGIKQPTLNTILGERKSKPSYDVLNAIATNTQVNASWLLMGEGDMKKDGTIQFVHHPKITDTLIENQDVILYDISAAANLKTLLADKSQNIIGKISLPNIPRCDGAVYVRGDSMYPLLKSGDIIAYKEIHDFSSVIKGEMYLVSFDLDGDEYLTVKYVNKSEQDGYIKLVSYNTHHEPMDIPISSINAMAIVKVSIRMNTMK